MENEMDLYAAGEAFAAVCAALDEMRWRYTKDEGKYQVNVSVSTKTMPARLTVDVEPKRKLVSLTSRMPVAVPAQKRADMAVAVSAVNNKLLDGSYDFNMSTGHIYFRLTNSFRGSTMSPKVYRYMMVTAIDAIGDYSDKLLGLHRGALTLDQALDAIG